jgi:hypothetical protein
MKRAFLILTFSAIFMQLLKSQTTVIQGKPIAEIFTDFHYIFNDTSRRSGFDMNRAHLGYNFLPGGDFSSTIIINIGSPVDLAEGSTPRRYAFFREASIAYNKEKLAINFGIVNTRYQDFQQGFWGKRFLGPEFEAAYGYGTVADLGVVLDYKFNNIIKVDLSVLNGEGYMNIQLDNSVKTAAGLTITAPGNIVFRLYSDIIKTKGVWQNTLIGFAGYKNDHFSIGGEASFKSNLDLTKGHNVWGLSATGSYFLTEKSEIFIRYDYAASVVVPGEDLQWDFNKDGTYFIGGFQFKFNSYLKMALNYRRTNPYYPGKPGSDAIYLNARFAF